MEVTEKFKRLPPLAGIPFVGFDFARIESREPIAGQLRSYIDYFIDKATSPTVQVIIGEWGEGKTEVFERYLKPEVESSGNYSYFVSASTVARSFAQVGMDSPLASVHFLGALFNAIRHETKSAKIPKFEKFLSTEEWLTAILETHASPQRGKGKIFIFIDELEDLIILDPDALKKILSGLKEIVNKQFKPTTEWGKYPGALCFFLLCTPDAYNKMQKDPDVAEVFGGWERRVRKIKLQPVTKVEGIKFLFDLLRYAYKEEIPSPSPMKSSGILHTLQAIGQGNLGALVTLFTILLNNASLNENQMRVITGEWLLDSLCNENISIHGGSARCVEKGTLSEIEGVLEDKNNKGKALFRLLAGELKPFSESELKERLELPTEDDALQLVKDVIFKLENAGIPNGFIRLLRFKQGISFKEVCQNLREEIKENEIRIDNFNRKLIDFEDDLTYVDLKDNVLTTGLFFPWDAGMIQAFFEGTSPESCKRIQHRLRDIVDGSKFYYTLSNTLITRLFPTPVPVGLEFIKDRDLRLKLWRDATTRFPDLFRENMPQAILSLIKCIDLFELQPDGFRQLRNGASTTIREKVSKAAVSSYWCAHYGDIGAQDIKRIYNDIQDVKPVHLIMLFHIGELTEEGEDEIVARELESHLLRVPLHTNLTKQLIIAYKSRKDYEGKLDEKVFNDSTTRILRTEIEIDSRLTNWLEEGVKTGLVIRDIKRGTARSEKDLADALKFYINSCGLRGTPEEIYKENTELLGLIPFGQRVGFAPDIESCEQFRKYTSDLISNRFVRETPEGRIESITSPSEQRILDIIQKEGTLSGKEIENYFVICAEAKNIVQDLYLDVLKHKGLIKERNNLFTIASRQKILTEAEEKYKSIQAILDTRKSDAEWQTFAHIFVTKQRASRLITIDQLHSSLERFYQSIQKIPQQDTDNVLLQRANLLCVLIEYSKDNLLPKINGAIAKAKQIRSATIEKVEDCEANLENLIRDYNKWLRANATASNLKEYRDLETGKAQLIQICKTPLSREELEQQGKLLGKKGVQSSYQCDREGYVTKLEVGEGLFSFRRWQERDAFFNIRLLQLEQEAGNLESKVEQCNNRINSIKQIIEELDIGGDEARSKLLAIRIGEDCKISKTFYEFLMTDVTAVQQQDSAATNERKTIQPVLTLRSIEDDLKNRLRPLKMRWQKVDAAINTFEDLLNSEYAFLTADKDCSIIQERLAIQADVNEYASAIEQFGSEVQNLQKSYVALEAELSKKLDVEGLLSINVIDKIKTKLEQGAVQLQNIQEELNNIWPRYIGKCRDFITIIHKTLKLVQKHSLDVNTQQLNEHCDMLSTELTNITTDDSEVRMSMFEGSKARIREETLELMKESLDKEHGLILISVIEKSESSQEKWFDEISLVGEISTVVKRPKGEVRRMLRSLIEKGYLNVGISIPI